MRRNSHRQLLSAFTRGVGMAIIAVAMLGVGSGAAQFPDTAPQPGAPRPVELPPFEQATLARYHAKLRNLDPNLEFPLCAQEEAEAPEKFQFVETLVLTKDLLEAGQEPMLEFVK